VIPRQKRRTLQSLQGQTLGRSADPCNGGLWRLNEAFRALQTWRPASRAGLTIQGYEVGDPHSTASRLNGGRAQRGRSGAGGIWGPGPSFPGAARERERKSRDSGFARFQLAPRNDGVPIAPAPSWRRLSRPGFRPSRRRWQHGFGNRSHCAQFYLIILPGAGLPEPTDEGPRDRPPFQIPADYARGIA